MQYLTQKDFREMMLRSFEKIDAEKEQINKINVFPVPDQDTGTNIANTLLGIKKAIEGKEFDDINKISQAILDGSLTAAQGNSGVIYTSFLAGFLSHINKNPVDARKLAIGFKEGAERARQAIQDPKEGTVLDVIDAAAKTIEEEAEKENNIIALLKSAIEKAKEALIATQGKMEVLKKARVVDAGGLAYLIILEGYLEALEGEKPEEEKKERPSEEVKKFVQILSNRYEVVSLIRNPKFSEKEIREKLKDLGDCLDIVQIGQRMKIHIHTDYPDDVKSIMRGIGEIESMREEDMAKEVGGEESVKKVSIGIVVDEVADLTEKIIDRYQIEVVRFKIDWPEGEKLAGENIYQKLKEAEEKKIDTPVKTSQASAGEFLAAYKKQFEKGFQHIICITTSSKLSGAYNSAQQALSGLPESQKNKVFVLDSMNGSAGEALLALKVIEMVQSQMDVWDIIAVLKKAMPNIKLYGFVADPRWLEKTGRINHRLSNWIRKLQKFHIFPFLTIKEGAFKPGGFVRASSLAEGMFKQIEKDSARIRREGKMIRVVITHCNNLESAKELKERLKAIKAEVPFINLVAPVTGVSIGPGALVAAWTEI